jgi:pimeloyl-ACP methyl ester carboxylesterase
MSKCLCREFLEAEVGGFPPERPVYLLGESFGGILAVAVAAARPDLVNRVVLVNPATSYERSAWPVLGPLLPMVPQVAALFQSL